MAECDALLRAWQHYGGLVAAATIPLVTVFCETCAPLPQPSLWAGARLPAGRRCAGAPGAGGIHSLDCFPGALNGLGRFLRLHGQPLAVGAVMILGWQALNPMPCAGVTPVQECVTAGAWEAALQLCNSAMVAQVGAAGRRPAVQPAHHTGLSKARRQPSSHGCASCPRGANKTPHPTPHLPPPPPPAGRVLCPRLQLCAAQGGRGAAV